MAKDIRVTLELDNRKYDNNLNKSKRQTKQFADDGVKNVNTLKNAFVALGGAAVVGSIVKIGQSFQDLQTSLNFVTGSAEAGQAAFDNLTRLATQTQFGVEELVQAFLLLQGSGIEPTNSLLLAFADTASVAQDQLGVLESLVSLFSRAASKGKIELEDLNKIADRGIPIYKVLTESFGKTIDEIKELAKTPAGQEELFRGIEKALDDTYGGALQEKLKNSSIAFSNLEIAARRLAASIFSESGLSDTSAIEGLTDAINKLADNTAAINSLANVFAGLVTVILSFGAVRGITTLMNKFQGSLTRLFTRMGDGRTKTKGLREAFRGLFGQTKASKFDDMTKGLTGTNKAIAETAKRTFTFTGGLATLSKTLLRFAGIAGIAFTVFETGKFIFSLFKDQTEEIEKAVEELEKDLETTTTTTEQYTLSAESLAKVEREVAESIKKTTEELEKQKDAFDKNDPLYDYQMFLKDIFEQAKKNVNEQDNLARAIRNVEKLLEIDPTNLYFIEAMRLLKGDTEETVTAFEDFEKSLGNLMLTTEEYNEKQRQLNALIEKYPELAEEAARAQDELDERLSDNEGLNSFLDTLGRAQKTLSEDLAEALVEGQNAGDVFKKFFKTMINQIIADIIRLQIIQPILGAILAPFGFGFGPGGRITGKASGGPVMGNRPYVVGEKGPELFVPTGSGTIIPNHQMGSGGTQVTYNINAIDTASFEQRLARNPEYIYNLTRVGSRRVPG